MKKQKIAFALWLCTASFACFANSESAITNSSTSGPFNWSGGYAGVHLGYAWGYSDFKDAEYNGAAPFPVVNWDVDDKGFLGGIQGGYNWQRKNIVYGLEGEFGYLNLDKKKFPSGVDPILLLPYDAAGEIDGNWYAGLSARLGYANDRTLIYGKLGAVYLNAELGFTDNCTTGVCGGGTINANERVGWGYQIGAGLEHALTDTWSLRAEYTYFDFGKETISGTGGGTSAGIHYDVKADLDVHALRLGLNYKF